MTYMGGIRGDGLPEGEAGHDVYVFGGISHFAPWYVPSCLSGNTRGRTQRAPVVIPKVEHTGWVQ
jgi:hypothetical protein